MAQTAKKAFILGLSGLTSSGKTTLARLLRTVFRPSCFILHQDDFFRPEEELPVVDGLADWDCASAIDFPAMMRALRHVHAHGTLPDDLDSKEDQNATGESGVSEQEVEDARKAVQRSGVEVNLAIMEGFLLFHDDEVMSGLDASIFLRAPYEKACVRNQAKQRREARMGYVTLEGFWEDPPGYFDKIVWPNYREYHKRLFVDGDIVGDVDWGFLKKRNTHTTVEADVSMNIILPWAVGIILDAVKGRQTGTGI